MSKLIWAKHAVTLIPFCTMAHRSIIQNQCQVEIKSAAWEITCHLIPFLQPLPRSRIGFIDWQLPLKTKQLCDSP